MNKACLCIWLVALLFLSVPSSGTKITISSGKKLVSYSDELATTKYDTVLLGSDIDLDGLTMNPIGGNSVREPMTLFNGNGYVIRNMKITSDDISVGFIGYLSDGTVQNLVIDESCNITSSPASGNAAVGGVIGTLKTATSTATVENVVNMATVTYAGTVTDYQVMKIGGIVGSCDGSYGHFIRNCVNHGTFVMAGTYGSNNELNLGGVVGYYPGKSSSAGLTNCVNYATISLTGELPDVVYAGGVIGFIAGVYVNTNLVNFGAVTTTTGSAGAIIGKDDSTSSSASNSGLYWKKGTATSAIASTGSSKVSSENSFNGTTFTNDGTSLPEKLGSDWTQIHFDEDGVDDLVLLVNDSYPVLPTPTRDGDSFIGWYMESTHMTLFSKTELKADTIYVYGKWASDGSTIPDVPSSSSSSASPSTFSSSSSLSLSSSSSSSNHFNNNTNTTNSSTPNSSSSSGFSNSNSNSNSNSLSSSSSSGPISDSGSMPSSGFGSSSTNSESSANSGGSSSDANNSQKGSDIDNFYELKLIFNKKEYSVEMKKEGENVELPVPKLALGGRIFSGWYFYENLTFEANLTVMPGHSVTLYSESFASSVKIVIDISTVGKNDDDMRRLVIKVLDDTCNWCYTIIKINVHDGKVDVIVAFKDINTAYNFIDEIQSNPNVRKASFVKPFSVDSSSENGGSSNTAFIVVIAVFATLFVGVVVASLVLYPFLMRSGKKNDSDNESSDIEMVPNYSDCDFTDSSDLSVCDGFDRSGCGSSANVPTCLPTVSATALAAAARIVPEDVSCDSAANPAAAMKIDSLYSEGYVPQQGQNADGLRGALMEAGVRSEVAAAVVRAACVAGPEDPFAPVRAYLYDVSKIEIMDGDNNSSKNSVWNNSPAMVLNRALVSGSDKELKYVRDWLFLLMAALRKMQPESGMTLYCGSRAKASKDYLVKDNYVYWPGFVSATTNMARAKELLCGPDGSEEQGTLFVVKRACGYRVKNPSSTSASASSSSLSSSAIASSLEEVLIEPECKFRVESVVRETKKFAVVTLSMADSPPPKVFDTPIVGNDY